MAGGLTLTLKVPSHSVNQAVMSEDVRRKGDIGWAANTASSRLQSCNEATDNQRMRGYQADR